jgi:trehalose 6-phosphate synthase/phosphatase
MDTSVTPAIGSHPDKLVVVSNRLPLVIGRDARGGLKVESAAGGLISAMLPVLNARGGTWIGWTGLVDPDSCSEAELDDAVGACGFSIAPVALSETEVSGFYLGFANEIVWPLFHDMSSFCNFDPSYWQSYIHVNRRFAKTVAEHSDEHSFVWVHDYHLINIATELRGMGLQRRTAFFLHIPFPALDIFLVLPWRQALLKSLLDFNLIGFQTRRDRRNFLQCLRVLLKDAVITGKGQTVHVQWAGRQIVVGHFPIGIDFGDFAHRAVAEDIRQRAQALHANLPNRQLLLGVDRLDYTKGIPLRLRAFREALLRHPELHHRVTLIQIVVPSREHISKYFDLHTEIEQIISRINGEFTQPGGWVPIHYVFRSVEPEDLLAYYRAAEVALVTPLKDGMNLVAKEYCTCCIEEDGVLILSEFAGAAAQLRHNALLVNPFDIEGVADAIYRACSMPAQERHRRMRHMRHEIMRRDVFWWVNSFMNAAADAADFAGQR